MHPNRDTSFGQHLISVLNAKVCDDLLIEPFDRHCYKTRIMTVCSYHVTCAFESESTLYNCLNFKELLARNKREI